MYVAATQYLLGIRPGLSGLNLTPCLPPWWGNFSLRRIFRSCTYTINFVKTGHPSLTLNGKILSSPIIPPQLTKTATVKVEW